jgi:parafibromin
MGIIDSNLSIDKNAPLEITVQQPIPISKLAKQGGSQFDNFQDFDSTNIKKQKLVDNNEKRERIAKRFEPNPDKSTRIADNTPSELSNLMPYEKLTAIKAKIIAKKREQITVSENDEELMQQNANQMTMSEEDSTIKDILCRERVWRNRTTILESNGKRFDTNIFAFLQSIQKKEEIQFQQQQLQHQPLNNKNDNPLSIINNQMSHEASSSQQNSKTRALNYSRFDQERYGPKDDTGGFSIDTKRSYQHGAIIADPQPSMTPQQTKQPQPTKISIVPSPTQSSSSQKRSSMRPIIVVPASRTSIITLYNASDILQDLKFVSSEDKRKNLQNVTKDSEIIMRRKEDGKTIQFKVVDNVSKLNREDWDRVVAVFAQGPSWQFKDWLWDGNPVEIFNKVKAFHIKWSGINLETNISKWSVTVIELDQNKRHLDRARLLTFWDELEK